MAVMSATPICTPRGSETGFEEVGMIGKEKSGSAPVSDDRVEQKIGYQAAFDEFSVFRLVICRKFAMLAYLIT